MNNDNTQITQPQETPQYSGMFSQILENLSKNASLQTSMFEKSREDTGALNNKFYELLSRIQEKEENAATGNPFIDMLNGYVKMKKRSNPNYQWEGFAPKIARGVGGLLGMNNIQSQAPVSNGMINPTNTATNFFKGPDETPLYMEK